jgi:hypothetical protein
MFAKRLQLGDQDGVVVDDDHDEHVGGGWSIPEAISTAVSPSEFLW